MDERSSGRGEPVTGSACEERGYHRIPALELECIECGEKFTPQQAIENEQRKIAKMETDWMTVRGHERNLREHSDALNQRGAELERLRASVRNQAGDNLCWLDNSGVTKIPEQAEFLESCRRYHAQVSGAVGVLTPEHMTIAQLEAELERLRAEQRAARIPPGMTPELMTLIADVIPHEHSCLSQYGSGCKCDCVVSKVRGWAAWLRESTVKESLTARAVAKEPIA